MKAVILNQDYNGKLAGEILMVVPNDWTHTIINGDLGGNNAIGFLADVPEGADDNHLKVTDVAEVVEVIASPERWTKDGEDDLFEDPSDVSYTNVPEVVGVVGVPAHKIVEVDTASLAVSVAQASLATAKALMDSDIRAFVASKTGSIGDAEMQAQVSSFSLRANNSALYIADGLTAHVASASFTQGDALDTAQKIQDFYNEILIEMDKDRQAHIVTYLTTKAGLGL